MIALSDRLKALKDANDTTVTSDSKEPTPLKDFLTIYIKANKLCFINYMANAERLYRYLSPIEFPDLSSKYSTSENLMIPDILSNYETQKLAELLTPTIIGEPIGDTLERRNLIEFKIVLCIINEVLPTLYIN